MATGNFTVDSVISERYFSIKAVIVGTSLRHFRDRDHSGTQDDTTVVLATGIGQYAAGTVLHDVLASLEARILAIGSTNSHIGGFKVDAFIHPYFYLNAVIYKAQSGTFSADAWFAYGGSFTLNSITRSVATGSFTANASIV